MSNDRSYIAEHFLACKINYSIMNAYSIYLEYHRKRESKKKKNVFCSGVLCENFPRENASAICRVSLLHICMMYIHRHDPLIICMLPSLMRYFTRKKNDQK